jgi:putative endonuclease
MKLTEIFGEKNKTSKKPTEKQVIGKIGEDCVCKYLKGLGYKITDRNYLKKWGEIDVVAVKDKKIHFVEVKSVSREISSVPRNKVTQETKDEYRPEDNMHSWKLQRLGRVIQSYLLDKDISDDIEWQFDVATVYVDIKKRISRVNLIEDLVL